MLVMTTEHIFLCRHLSSKCRIFRKRYRNVLRLLAAACFFYYPVVNLLQCTSIETFKQNLLGVEKKKKIDTPSNTHL